MTDARVLIVEDEVLVAEGLQRALTASGYAVVGHAMAAGEAIESVERWRPEIVLMDVNLDGASEGIDAARTIRHVSDAAVVFVSAHTDETVVRNAIDAGALGFVVKPFQPRQVTAAIEVALRRRRDADREPRQPSEAGPGAGAGEHEYAVLLGRLETILYDEIPGRFRITTREWDVVRGLVCYRRLPRVAKEMGISGCTARNHLKSVFRKLNVHSQEELFRFLLGA